MRSALKQAAGALLVLLTCAGAALLAGLAVREFTTGAFAKYAGVVL